MVTDGQVDGFEIQFQLTGLMQFPEVAAGFAGVFGDQQGIFVVQQMGVFPGQGQGGRRFGRHDVIALPDGIGQEFDVRLCDSPRAIERAQRDHRHAGLLLFGVHEDGDSVVFHHGHQRVGQLRVEPVGVDVDESRAPFGRCGAWGA